MNLPFYSGLAVAFLLFGSAMLFVGFYVGKLVGGNDAKEAQNEDREVE